MGISIKICDFIAVDEFSDSDDSKMETFKRSKVRQTISTVCNSPCHWTQTLL